ncbi:MAG: iron chelate uptake ABC transporter family permease subunit, partial [Clostridiales bacterium]|nr:iron chelate uptake ABC transporter family permease subunit [Clostridiales bacterium]
MSKKYLVWAGFALLPVGLVLLVTVGPADISVGEAFSVILSKLKSPFSQPMDSAYRIVWLLRLPRLLMAALVGGGLAVCGAVLQAFFRNPMADPYIIGLSSGAALGTALSYVTGA